jgi:uncharacterized protein (TIGR02246 family)
MPVHRLVRLVPAALAAVVALAASGATGVTGGADRSAADSRARGSCQAQQGAVRGFLPRIVAAWAEGDADDFAAVFTKDASFIVPGQDTYLRSREEIRAYMAAGFAGPLRGVRATATILDLRCLSRDVAVVVTQGGLLFPGETVVPPERVGRQTWVVRKQGSQWRAAAYQNSRISS